MSFDFRLANTKGMTCKSDRNKQVFLIFCFSFSPSDPGGQFGLSSGSSDWGYNSSYASYASFNSSGT